MMSAQKLVEDMLRPLDEVYNRIQAKLFPMPATYAELHDLDEGDAHDFFILHREQWNSLGTVYTRIVGDMKSQILRMLEPVMATLHALFSAMQAAEKSFQECVAPHLRVSSIYINMRPNDLSYPELISLVRKGKGITYVPSYEQPNQLELEKDLRLWMVKHALRHILDYEVPHRHMDNLLTTSTAVFEALLHVNYLHLLADARQGKVLPPSYTFINDAVPSNDIPVIYTRRTNPNIEPYIRRVRNHVVNIAPARLFFSSSVANEIDRHISEMILERLGSGMSGEKLAIDIERLTGDPIQFRKTDRKLGKGSFGSVKLWNWISEENQVAVKKGSLGSKEIEIQARVRHPNVLPLLCCAWKEEEGNDEKSLLLVTERMDSNLDKLIDDESRRRRLDKGPPFPLPVSVEIMLQIAKGMDYLHNHDIMHRDLKPANILVSGYHSTTSSDDDPLQFLRVKVADFGASKDNFKTFDPGNSYRVGSGFYRAPEVIYEECSEGYSRKADVYSFAMVCYRILSGMEPFHDYNSVPLRDLYERLRKGELRPKLEFESNHNCMALVGMIKQCWSSNASKRPDFAEIAAFLRFIKMCILQQPMMFRRSRTSSGPRQDLGELLKSVDIFSTFCRDSTTSGFPFRRDAPNMRFKEDQGFNKQRLNWRLWPK